MDIETYIAKLKEFKACGDSIKDALNYKTSQEVWENCQRGDWMLWLISKIVCPSKNEEESRKIVAIQLSLEGIVAKHEKVLNMLEFTKLANKFIDKEITFEEHITACCFYRALRDYMSVSADKLSAGLIRAVYPNIDELFEKYKK